MFIGHYGAALAIGSVDDSVSLGRLFVAVQWVDVLFMSFVLLGIEKVRIVPGFTEYNPYDLYFMPYTHGVLAHLIWAALAVVGVRFVIHWSWRASWWLGAAVVSHLLLDLPVHTPDMPVGGDDTVKLGLGLWNHLPLAMALEMAVFAIGFGLFLRKTRLTRGMWFLAGVLLAVLFATPFLPTPGSDTELAVQALVVYVVLAAVAGRVAKRTPAPERTSNGIPLGDPLSNTPTPPDR